MLISLRSTNGGGKSTVIRNLFSQITEQKLIYGVLGPRLPQAYRLTVPKVERPTFVLGPYVTACGGCDRLIPFDLIIDLIEQYAPRGHVVFEGVIVGSIYGRVGTLMEKYKKDAVMLFLDTSLEECIRRVKARRADRTDLRSFNPKNLTTKFKATQHVKDKVVREGIMQVATASSVNAHKVIIKLLQGAQS